MLAILALATSCLVSTEIVVPVEGLALTHQLEVLREDANALSFDEVSGATACERFKPADGLPNYGGAGGGVWVRFRADLSAAAPSQWRLAVRFPGLDKVCVYWPLSDGQTHTDCAERLESADHEHGASRWQSGRLLFAVPETYNGEGITYVYAESANWLRLPLELATVDALLQQEPRDEFDWGLYFGLMLAFAVFGLMFFTGVHDRTYLYFALHVVTLTLAMLMWHGQLTRFDPSGWSLTRGIFSMAALFMASGAGFYQLFLNTQNHLPAAHRLLDICLWLSFAMGAFMWIWPGPLTQLVGVVAIVWVLGVVWASLGRLLQGYRPAALVLGVISLLLAGIILAVIRAFGLRLVHSDLAFYLLHSGGLVTAVLLGLGMIWRIRKLITERDHAGDLALANQRLALHRMSHDELTGLPRRVKFREILDARLAESRSTSKTWALVSVSLDNFRSLSHAIGQDTSDAVLNESVLRLKDHMHAEDLLGILGHSFVWLTEQGRDDQDHAELRARCRGLQAGLSAPLSKARGTSLQVSMGFAVYPQHETSAEALMRRSDEALYQAQQKKNGLEAFHPSRAGHSERELEMSRDLQQAILRDELELFFQPIVSFTGAHHVLAAEALVRWRRDGKLVLPDRFISVAESSGLIVPLSDWVLRRACRQLSDWRRARLPVLSISVNISPNEFRLPGFVSRIEQALKETNAPASGLVLELTEGVLVEDLQAAGEVLNQLTALGLKTAVDDFGVGYSSLSYLRNLPVSIIKIDRSFLKGIPAEAEAVSVISAIITMGRDLSLKVTAEGVETTEQEQFLIQRGVNSGQGWLFGKAMPVSEFESWLQQRLSGAPRT